jgi:hypothetical protein
MQYAIKVCDRESLNDLNENLDKGWKVINMCAMPSSINTNSYSLGPTCLVIIEKEENVN